MTEREQLDWDAEDFFVEGGTLEPDAPSYVTRQADTDLWQALLVGDYCNVLTARQMGKSSLMVRTRSRLQTERGIRTVVIDLTAIGTEGISIEAWYLGLMGQLKRQLALQVDEVAWWSERSQMGAVQRFSDFLRQVVLVEIQEPVVVFVDEIDSTLALNFTDDFFAAIRAAYNARAKEPVYKRLTFVLLGVARPADLIKDRSRTPYNIGTAINIQDFTTPEAKTLLAGLEAAYPGRAEAILQRILYWTDGHPYLTQKVCAQLVQEEDWATIGPDTVDPMVERLFLAEEARRENNLQFIQDRLRKSEGRVKMLKVYDQTLADKEVPDEERSPIKSQLKLSGLVKATPAGQLTVRNRIYRTVFDAAWVKENRPVSTMQRVAVAAVAVAVLAVLIAGYFFYEASTRPDAAQADLYISGFQNNSLSEVRLNNLAGLFGLSGYADQARDLFFELEPIDQTTLFTELNDPAAAETDVMTVVQQVYQDQRLGGEAIPLLRAMSQALPQSEEENAEANHLSQALGYWANGRTAANNYNYPEAVEQFGLALDRNPAHPAILYDRGLAHIEMGDLELAAADFEAVVDLDENRTAQVEQVVNGNPALFTLIGQNRSQYPALAAIFPTLTPTPTLPPDQTPTPTPTFTPRPPGTPVTINTAPQMTQLAQLGRGEVNDISVSPDGETLVIAGGQGIWLYDLETLEPLTTAPLADAAVAGVAWSPDGTQFVSWPYSGDSLQIWDVRRAEFVETIVPFRVVGASKDSIIWLPDNRFQSADNNFDGSVNISLDATSVEFNSVELDGHEDWIRALAWSPDGTRLATAGNDNRVIVWDVESATQIREFSEGVDNDTVAWSTDGEFLAMGIEPFGALIWNSSTNEEQRLGSPLEPGDTEGLAWSPDASLLAIGKDDVFNIWQVSTGEPIQVLEDNIIDLDHLAWTLDDQRLISNGDDGIIRLWDIETGEVIQTVEGWFDFIDIMWSPDGSRLAAGDSEGFIRIWDKAQKTTVEIPNERTSSIRDMIWSADEFQLVTANSDALQMWDTVSRQQINYIELPEGIEELNWSPDQTRFAHTGEDNNETTIYIRDTATGEVLHQLLGHTEAIYELIWSPDGQKLYSDAFDDGIRVWDVENGELLYALEQFPANLLQFSVLTWSPDSNELLVFNYETSTLQFLDATSGEVISEIGDIGDRFYGLNVWSPDEQTIAFGTSEGLLLWNKNSNQFTRTTVEGVLIDSIAWSPDGSLLAFSVDDDFTVRLLDPATGQELSILAGHKDDVEDLQWSPDGALLASRSRDGTVMVWGVDENVVPAEVATPTPTPIPPTPTTTATPNPTPTPSPQPTPTPIDQTQQLILDRLQAAAPLGSDKGGFILVNCSNLAVDWYIEQPRSEYRQVAIVPPFDGNQCGVSHVEGLFSIFEHQFSFTAQGVYSTFDFIGVQVPAGQVVKLEITEFGPGEMITYRRAQNLGDLVDLQGN